MAQARDALTGAPVSPRTRFILRLSTDTDERPAPMNLHAGHSETAVVSHEDRRNAPGGLAFSPAMAKYLKNVQPARWDFVTLLWHQWWRFPYVRERLAATMGADKAALVVRYRQTGAHPADLAADYGKGPAWAYRAIPRAEHLVRRKWLPYGELDHLRTFADTLLPL